ncbi:hypothetical protein [Domibacillus enclensis]|uniref:Uncharacterized protein n=1 Tax=Domibacillus enclensis TaxID=1017273 RepID=A0A1N6Y4J2_9BACI|nr:hypothetical protein [Domibacillus enclensis]OXS77511.1 hypothetical protein B1B05_11790 [Domibacillus enclensis]SIR09446.1 hypothetical protein SAMN05443094_105147 [Domibacillus enclensis]
MYNKRLFIVSLLVNLVLSALVLFSYIHSKRSAEELTASAVSDNLIALNGLISSQESNGWERPEVVVSRMGDVLTGLIIASSHVSDSGFVDLGGSNELRKLYIQLSSYPNDAFFLREQPVLSPREQQSFEQLQIALTDAGLGMNMTTSSDWEENIHTYQSLIDALQTNAQNAD